MLSWVKSRALEGLPTLFQTSTRISIVCFEHEFGFESSLVEACFISFSLFQKMYLILLESQRGGDSLPEREQEEEWGQRERERSSIC